MAIQLAVSAQAQELPQLVVDELCSARMRVRKDRGMRVIAIEHDTQLERLTSTWNQLSADNPMLSPTWLLTWWRHYRRTLAAPGCAARLLVLAVFDAHDELVAIAPWFTTDHPIYRRTIRCLGTGEVCTDHLTIVCRPKCEPQAAAAIADWLMKHQRQEWNLLQLDGIRADDRMMPLLQQQLAQHGALIQVQPAMSSWYVELPATWEEYLASLSKNHRKRCRRWTRNYFDSGRATVRIAGPEDLDATFYSLQQLHTHRRQDHQQTSRFQQQRFRDFHREVIRRFSQESRLRLAALKLDDQEVACEYQFHSEAIVFAYQSGMRMVEEVGVGNLSLLASLRWAVENGFKEFDLLRGDERYKTSWGAQRRDAITLNIRPDGVWTGMQHRCSLATQATRNWLRKQAIYARQAKY